MAIFASGIKTVSAAYLHINVELAARLGMNGAACAQCLWDGVNGALEAEVTDVKGRRWIRMGHKQLALTLSCLTPRMTKSALRKLTENGIVYSLKLNESPFDHTHWYAFTDFGQEVMLKSAAGRDERCMQAMPEK